MNVDDSGLHHFKLELEASSNLLNLKWADDSLVQDAVELMTTTRACPSLVVLHLVNRTGIILTIGLPLILCPRILTSRFERKDVTFRGRKLVITFKEITDEKWCTISGQ